MNLAEFENGLRELQTQAQTELGGARSAEHLERWRVKYLGTKGALKAAMQRLKAVPKADKPAAGQAANKLKDALQAAYDARATELAPRAPNRRPEACDVTLPGRRPRIGHAHVITQTVDELVDIFARMGFTMVYGPEVEDDRHNFVALNIPPEHVARDPLDNFYIDEATMLRSQTSTVQIRAMELRQPPVRIITAGRCYRPDTVDATHMFIFHQLECLCVDEGVTMVDMRTCIDQFCKAYFGPEVKTRFLPSFFPFTEPSGEIAVSCPFCHGGGCAICKQSGWMELGGCGMVDPNVLEAVGYDTEKYTGYAFGFGIERMAMRRHGIPDIRLLFENDVRFLHQF
ncbi:MAG: phenylalanine--tRNA ligase subunit alpha [Phycisphaerae bacterium]|nr:phenylalanine--tRNA ligase subunit alpha [Phycisphaerae bacterium]